MPIPDPSEYEWAYAQRHITSPYTERVCVGSTIIETVLVVVPGDTHECHVLFIPEDDHAIRDWCEYGIYDGWTEVTDEFRSIEIDTETERLFAESHERALKKVAADKAAAAKKTKTKTTKKGA